MMVQKSLVSLIALGIFLAVSIACSSEIVALKRSGEGTNYPYITLGGLDAPQLSAPIDGSTVSFPLNLRWISVNNVYSYTLEYSRFITFQDVTSLDLFGTDYTLTSALEDGRWYWHVRANTFQSESGPWSAAWSFEVGLPVPLLKSPRNGTSQNISEVYFDWSDVKGGQKGGELYDFDHFVLQYSISSIFASQNTFTIGQSGGSPLRDSQYGPINLADGVYYWRVRAVYARYPDGSFTEGGWSTSFGFSISTGGGIVHSVELIQPLNVRLETHNPAFVWRILLNDYWNVASWTLELASDPQMLWNRKTITIELADLYSTISEDKVTNHYTLTSSQSLPDGTWYWHVTATDRMGSTSFFSPIESFVMDAGEEFPAKAELISPPNGFEDAPRRLSFSWSQVTGATSYDLQVAYTSNFTSLAIDQGNIIHTSYMIQSDLEPGTYYWRVISDAPNAQWSDIWSFTVDGEDFLQVELISPEDNAQNIPLCPLFQWKPLEGVTVYTLEVSTTNSFTSHVVIKTGLINPSWGTLSDWKFNDPPELESGTYYWRVSSDLENSTSAIWTFTVSEEKGDEKISVAIVLSNREGDPISGATIVLSSGGKIMGIATSNEFGKASVSGLETGSYILEVTAAGYHSYKETVNLYGNTTENIILYRKGIIHGHVYYDDIQNPAQNVKVVVYDSKTQSRVASDITDDNGYFIVDNITDNRTYYIVVEEYEDQKEKDIIPVSIPNSSNSLIIIIKLEGKIVGVVQDEDGNLLHDAKVTLKDVIDRSINTVSTDKIGSFTFDVLPGDYCIEVTLSGHEKYKSEMFNVKSEEIKDLELITLRHEIGTLQVSLNDEKGEPIEGFVTINDVDGKSIETLSTVKCSVSVALITSNYFIVIDAPGFTPRILPVTVQKENEPVIVELKTRLGNISITVLDTDGDPISIAVVFVDGEEVGITDEEGNLMVESVVPGEHDIAVKKSKHFPFEQRISVARGGVLPINVTLEAETFVLKIWYFICQYKLPMMIIYTFFQSYYTFNEFYEKRKNNEEFSLWKTIFPILGIFFVFVDVLHLKK